MSVPVFLHGREGKLLRAGRDHEAQLGSDAVGRHVKSHRRRVASIEDDETPHIRRGAEHG